MLGRKEVAEWLWHVLDDNLVLFCALASPVIMLVSTWFTGLVCRVVWPAAPPPYLAKYRSSCVAVSIAAFTLYTLAALAGKTRKTMDSGQQRKSPDSPEDRVKRRLVAWLWPIIKGATYGVGVLMVFRVVDWIADGLFPPGARPPSVDWILESRWIAVLGVTLGHAIAGAIAMYREMRENGAGRQTR